MELAVVSSQEEEFVPVSQLNSIREIIESMNKFNQIEVLRLLSKHKNEVIFNENKYGIHINLTELKKEIIDELQLYIHYVSTQEDTLDQVEQQKESFKNIYFTKDNKDNNASIIS
jgi:methionine aminopeptidase